MLATSPAASAPPAAIHFAAETTGGITVTFPDDAHGKDLILIVTFTREAGKRAQLWSDALAAHAVARASIVSVAVLDRVPGFLRGMIRNAIAKDAGPPQTGKLVVTTTDGGSLRAAAPSGDRDDPVIYVLAPDGSVAAARRAPYSADAERQIESALP